MKYITSRELSKKWGVSQRRIVLLASEGRIEGAKFYGRSWVFPKDAKKPTDGRTKEAKKEGNIAEDFRCPIFEFRDAASFYPHLGKDERTIKRVTEAFIACKYGKAKKALGNLADRTEDRYIRIAALYSGCMCAIYLCDEKYFYNYYGRLREEFVEDFPHKVEMEEYLHQIDATLGDNRYYAAWPQADLIYAWHKSFLSRLSNISNVWLSTGEHRPSKRDLVASERNLLFVEELDAPFDEQAIHIYLGCAYAVEGMTQERDYHFSKALYLAEKYDMFYTIAVHYFYMRAEFKKAISKFSPEFKEKVRTLSDDYYERFSKFADKIGVDNFHKKISDNDYIFISLALQDINHKEISKRLGISVSSVTRHYSKIYEKLGVRGKNEMLKMFR